MIRAGALVGLAAALGLAGCDAAPTGLARFEQTIAPIIEARCASAVCHGVLIGAEAAGETVDWDRLFFQIDAHDRLVDAPAAYRAVKRTINTAEAPEFSSLLRKPLPVAFGGHPHHGKDNFTSPADPDYVTLRDWIADETEGGEVPPALTPNERLFAETVQPALVSGVCMNANCHGVGAPVPFRLEAGVGGQFSAEMTRANYEASLSMLSIDGDPMQSRLLRKALPLHDGGIVHKGANGLFTDRGDPRVQAIRRWACVERADRIGAPCEAADIAGFVFVRGPMQPGGAFDLDRFVPGSDLFLARLGGEGLVPTAITNLTASLHEAPADVRDPAVDTDGAKLVFAMRTGPETGHDLYEMDLDSRAVERLTNDAGPLPGGGMRTYRDPTYAPNGDIWFTSTRAGALTDRGDVLDGDLYQLDRQTGAIVRRTYTPHAERKPVFLVHGEENGGEVAFTALREAVPNQRRAHPFRFPPDLSTEYHQHFGITPPEDFFHDVRELPDGRYALTVGDLTGVWRAGRLGIVDRNFGPEIPSTMVDPVPGMPFYAPPLVRLDPDAAAVGVTQGLYRDVAPLPDGRLLVAYAPQTIDLADPEAVFDLRIEVLTLAEALDGSGPRIVDRAVLVDEPGVMDRDPEPILRRQPAPMAPPKWDPGAETGRFFHNGLPLIDALLGNLPPTGPKASTAAFRYVRLVEAMPSTPGERRPVPSAETQHGQEGASSVSLAPLDRARILAELPLAADGSFQVEIPAGVPFRLQGLDADRMAVGSMHNRWYYVAPGQKLVQGADADVYNQRCAACHGSDSGNPDDVFGRPDVLTTASVTLSRYANRDPRRPLPMPFAGADARIEVDFLADVQPIFDQSCATLGCHIGPEASAGLNLSATPTEWFNEAYEGLLEPAKGLVDLTAGSARHSHLIEMLTGRELHAERSLRAAGEPHPADLDPQALLTLIRWIDLGAAWRGRP